jgi:hypothetical protein
MNKNLFQLIDEKYNIELEQYWNLPEKDKDDISYLILSQISLVIEKHPESFNEFEYILINRIRETEMNEEYERAEILKRVLTLMFKKYS